MYVCGIKGATKTICIRSRYIFYNPVREQHEKDTDRNTHTTYWASYWEEMQARLWELLSHFGTVENTEIVVVFLQQATFSSYKYNLPHVDNNGQKKDSQVEPKAGKALQGNHWPGLECHLIGNPLRRL
jgi:hypothetical protein